MNIKKIFLEIVYFALVCVFPQELHASSAQKIEAFDFFLTAPKKIALEEIQKSDIELMEWSQGDRSFTYAISRGEIYFEVKLSEDTKVLTEEEKKSFLFQDGAYIFSYKVRGFQEVEFNEIKEIVETGLSLAPKNSVL